MPSVSYWIASKGSKSCKIGETVVRVADVKIGKEATGKHIDSQVVFFCDRDKVVCHFYNTTQLVLVNGHGYSSFIETYLKPYFTSKIQLKKEEINNFNAQALESLTTGPKKVKRSEAKTLKNFVVS